MLNILKYIKYIKRVFLLFLIFRIMFNFKLMFINYNNISNHKRQKGDRSRRYQTDASVSY